VRTTEELLEWKSRKPRLMAVEICYTDHATPSTCKVWH
jgi:hypothetical protein